MTGFPGPPYPWGTIRLEAAISTVVTLAGCATDSATRAELQELRASLRALRQENGRIEARLETLERQVSRPLAPKSTGEARPASGEDLPALAVVKLKPRPPVAPRLATRVEVVEPPLEVTGEAASKAGGTDGEASQDEAALAAAEGAYEKGVEAMKTGNVEGGLQQLRRFAGEWPKHPRADNALYFVGLALLNRQDYAGAAEVLARVGAQYPAGDARVDSMLKLGECHLRLNQPQLAKAVWEKVVSAFPGTAAASQAQARLASLSVEPIDPLP